MDIATTIFALLSFQRRKENGWDVTLLVEQDQVV